MRLVTDLSRLKAAVELKRFKLHRAHQVFSLAKPGHVATTIHLNKPFYSLPLHKHSPHLLRTLLEGIVFRYNALPISLPLSPTILQLLLSKPLNQARATPVTILHCMHHLLIVAQPEDLCTHLDIVLRPLTSHAFHISLHKSWFVPCHQLSFLRCNFDLLRSCACLPGETRRNITHSPSSI